MSYSSISSVFLFLFLFFIFLSYSEAKPPSSYRDILLNILPVFLFLRFLSFLVSYISVYYLHSFPNTSSRDKLSTLTSHTFVQSAHAQRFSHVVSIHRIYHWWLFLAPAIREIPSRPGHLGASTLSYRQERPRALIREQIEFTELRH